MTRFSVAGAEGYMTASSYPDDGVGEVFLKLGKQGSTPAGVMDAFSMAISVGLQYGIPLDSYVAKFTNMRFEQAGLTDDPDIRIASSVMDYIFRRLALDHLPYEDRAELGSCPPPSGPPRWPVTTRPGWPKRWTRWNLPSRPPSNRFIPNGPSCLPRRRLSQPPLPFRPPHRTARPN